MGDNGKKWDVNQILTFIGVLIGLLGLIIAVIAVVVTITTPELRNYFGFEKENQPAPAPQLEIIPPNIATPPAKSAAVPKPKPPVPHKAQEPADPYNCTIGENKSEFAKAAKTSFSVKFHNIGGEETASVIIAPDIKEQIILPTVGSGSREFTSSTGVFLVHILNVDWNSRTVTVQVSRKE